MRRDVTVLGAMQVGGASARVRVVVGGGSVRLKLVKLACVRVSGSWVARMIILLPIYRRSNVE
jgi:hypothetical protein